MAEEAGTACPPHHLVASPLLIMPGYLPYTAYSGQRDGGDWHTRRILQVSEKDAGSAMLC